MSPLFNASGPTEIILDPITGPMLFIAPLHKETTYIHTVKLQ